MTLPGGLRVSSSAAASLNCLALTSSFACLRSPFPVSLPFISFVASCIWDNPYSGRILPQQSRSASASSGASPLSQGGPARRKSGRHMGDRGTRSAVPVALSRWFSFAGQWGGHGLWSWLLQVAGRRAGCFVLFCLPCNARCACGGMTTAETAFPPSNLWW